MKIKLFVAAFAMTVLQSSVVNAQTPRPEYPRPQFERSDWVNLNGTWTYTFDFGKTGVNRGFEKSTGFDGNITVPAASDDGVVAELADNPELILSEPANNPSSPGFGDGLPFCLVMLIRHHCSAPQSTL